MANYNFLTTKKDTKKEVRYLTKEFGEFRKNLLDFAQIYYPNTYNDFNESSPGMMFIEMASYVGDVLSYYIDKQFKENLLGYAEERKNVMSLAQTMGYKPTTTVPATTELDVFQIVPSILTGTEWLPDTRYALTINSGMRISSKNFPGVTFRTIEDVNFKFSSKLDPMEITVYEHNGSNPTYFLYKKKVKAVAGNIGTQSFTIGNPTKYKELILDRKDITEIVSVVDSDDNIWYETPYLAQDTIYTDVENTEIKDPTLSKYSDSTPYLLKLKKVPRRFVTKILSDNRTKLVFGAGVSDGPDEEIIPNPTSVGNALGNTPNYLTNDFDPVNFLFTKSYGQAPSNTTLTITYAHGGGIETNVPQDDLNDISFVDIQHDANSVPSITQLRTVKQSIACTNVKPATGGKSGETIEEIRQNALAHFPTQNRAVTKQDYIVRAYSLPAKYGNIAKAYITQDEQLNVNDTINSTHKNLLEGGNINRVENPLALNLYTLGYDASMKLVLIDDAVKHNLRTYLSQFRMLTDSVNILDGYIVNFGIEFEVIVLNNYNKREVVLRCIDMLKQYFNIDRWQINQPIIKSDVSYQMSLIEGVQNVTMLNFRNIVGGKYSQFKYDLKNAEPQNDLGEGGGIIYPSVDPMIFELKYPNSDITGRAR